MPWLPDRLLRHVLADPTGDMRRAELCMDALFDPANAHRRLGRLVVRSSTRRPTNGLRRSSRCS